VTRRERLIATLEGKPVDRPAVCFYELNGLDEKPEDDSPFNIYSHPSWRPLLDLTRETTDRIVMRRACLKGMSPDPLEPFADERSFTKDGSRFTVRTIKAGGRTLRERTRRDPDINTIWVEEHLLKDLDDLKAFLELPLEPVAGSARTKSVLDAEEALGDSGIVMLDTPDPLCLAAELFDMSDYLVVAMSEPTLFRRLLDRLAPFLYSIVGIVSEALPGRLWRIYGPEYATPPYLPPRLFREYVAAYDQAIIDAIHRHGGYARIHSHGKIKEVLEPLHDMTIDGLDPVEPPPQGDVELRFVRETYGREWVLFGNLEISDIENLPADRFAEKIKRAMAEGTAGNGRGFVLMPSSCPYGRIISPLAVTNYEKMIEIAAAG